MAFDAYATQPHYVNPHILAVLRALPADRRGTVYVESNRAEFARLGGDIPIANGRPPYDSTDPVLIAGGADIQAGWSGRPAVLIEHGAGQTYLGAPSTPAYSGGDGRDQVSLFLCPNEWTADRNQARYPDAAVAIVGAPHLDPDLRAARSTLRGTSPPVVAVTFHWDGSVVAPEAGTGWPYWAPHVLGLGAGRTLLGHAHPRIAHRILPWWTEHGVTMTGDPNVVLALADVVVADNTSLLYDAARLDVPVVVLDCPQYRHGVWHGPPRFWDYADVGVRISDPADLPAAVDLALADPPWLAEVRRRMAAVVYPYVGAVAAGRAAAAILDRWPGSGDGDGT